MSEGGDVEEEIPGRGKSKCKAHVHKCMWCVLGTAEIQYALNRVSKGESEREGQGADYNMLLGCETYF
jgi:hypothetical protein